MKILPAPEAKKWLKARRRVQPSVLAVVPWPERPETRAALVQCAEEVSAMSNWRGGAVILERPGMPRPDALAALCNLHAEFGQESTPEDIKLGNWPGHLFEGDDESNRGGVKRLLEIMMSGYLEGHLVTKSGRFWMSVCCGVLEFRVAEKAAVHRVRALESRLRGSPEPEPNMAPRRRTMQ